MILEVDIEFEMTDIVYLKTDPDQYPRMVIAITVYPNKSLLYVLSQGADVTRHMADEIAYDKAY